MAGGPALELALAVLSGTSSMDSPKAGGGSVSSSGDGIEASYPLASELGCVVAGARGSRGCAPTRWSRCSPILGASWPFANLHSPSTRLCPGSLFLGFRIQFISVSLRVWHFHGQGSTSGHKHCSGLRLCSGLVFRKLCVTQARHPAPPAPSIGTGAFLAVAFLPVAGKMDMFVQSINSSFRSAIPDTTASHIASCRP